MNVAILDDYQHVALSYVYWSGLPAEVAVVPFHDLVTDPDELVARLEPFEVVVAMRERTPLPRSVLERLPRLRLLVTTGMANAVIDLDAATDLGVTVCGTRVLTTSTVELTWALILAAVRGLPAREQGFRAEGWHTGRGQAALGGDLAGATLGVVGLGRIGAKVAAIGAAFGMRVVAWSQNLTSVAAARHGVPAVSKEELLRSADVVTLHLRLSERTRGLLGAAELAMMKPTAYLVNTSRGPLVDEAALVAAVSAGRLGGVGLDVYDTEPLPPDHPLRDLPNAVLLPHLGYVSQRTFDVFYRDIVEAIAAYRSGSPVRVLG
ncbi:D-2-hydroxyacid dehydrogenase family protein [Actinophytocola sediminis]